MVNNYGHEWQSKLLIQSSIRFHKRLNCSWLLELAEDLQMLSKNFGTVTSIELSSTDQNLANICFIIL